MKHITRKDLNVFQVFYPKSKTEQTKIAEILSTVDKAIEQTEAIIAKQQRIKTGLMQDLLTKGIDANGNIRSEETHQFKDSPLGRIPVEWEVVEFFKKVELIHGYQFRNFDFTESGIPIVKIGEITDNGLKLSNCSFISLKRVKQFKNYKLKNGDVLMALTGATLGKVCRVRNSNIILLQNYRVGRFEPRLLNEVDKTYLYFTLSMNYLLNQIFSRVNSGAQGNIGKADFEKALIKIPPYSEQTRIAELLESVDKLLEKEKINFNKQLKLKTALMQDLLTGKVRVTGLLEKEKSGAAV